MIQWGSTYFERKKVDSPRLTIELLLCHVLTIQRVDLYLQYDRPLRDIELKELHTLVSKRVSGEPLQYLTGGTNFLGLELKIDKAVLIPRPETEQLVTAVFDFFSDRASDFAILDIGTGSGNIAISLAKQFYNSPVMALDAFDEPLSLAKENAILNKATNIEFVKCDILRSLPKNAKFDIIVSNPPYISKNEIAKLETEVKDFEPYNSLTDESDGLTFYRRFAEIFPRLLNENGKFFLEVGFNQSEALTEIFKESGFEIKLLNDFQNIPRILTNS